MAVTVLNHLKESSGGNKAAHLKNCIYYITNPEKTEAGLWIGGNVGREPGQIYKAMMDTKNDWGKRNGRQGYHFVISFRPQEADEETAYAVGKEFCEKYLHDNFDYCFAVHNDQEHMHCHIVFNSVSRMDGHKYRYVNGDWEKDIQPITDMLCQKYGLSELVYEKEKKVGTSYAEHDAEKNGKVTQKMIIRMDIDAAIQHADNYETFLRNLREMGYKLESGYSEKRKSDYLALTMPGAEYARRDYHLGDGYSLEEIIQRIITKERAKDEPRLPPLQLPALSMKKMSRYQVRLICRVNQAYRYHDYALPAAAQARARKDLLKIEKLQEDCWYLITKGLQSEKDIRARLEIVKLELRNCYRIRDTRWEKEGRQSDAAALQHRLEAEKEMLSDEAFKRMQDELEAGGTDFEARAGSMGNRTWPGLDDRIQSLRREKNILRRLLRESEITWQVTPLEPIHNPSRERNLPEL